MNSQLIERYIIFLLISSLSNIIIAQQISVGLSAGLSSSNVINNEENLEAKRQLGMDGGIESELRISKNFLIGSGLSYIQKGFKREITLTDIYGNAINEFEIFYNYHYLVLPVIIQIEIGKKVNLGSHFGFYSSYLLNGNYNYPIIGNNGEIIRRETTKTTEYIPKIDIGIDIGIYMRYSVCDKMLLKFIVGYDQSITNHFSKSYFPESDKMKNNSIILRIGGLYNFFSKNNK